MNTAVRPADRLSGALYGLLVGDALGVPYEFHPPGEIPAEDEIDYTPPPGFRRAHAGVPPGTWSDDGAQALCLLASLLEHERLDLDDFAFRLSRWYDAGYLAVDGIVFDVGITTGRAMRLIAAGVRPEEAGPDDAYSNGNGALMRVLPLALWHEGTDAELVRDARRQSRVTHGHLRSQLCCALYCLWARRLLQDHPEAWADALATLRALIATDPVAVEELEGAIRPDADATCTGGGYVVDALRSARWAVEAGDYRGTVLRAIRLGNDTDTTACIAGGIAGLIHGIDAIPPRWREGLRGRALLDPLLQGLLARHARR